MKITRIETFTVGAGWKSWLFVRLHTDSGLTRIGEGTLNGFNTARGPIIDLDALAEAMRAAGVAGAGLDVLPKEPGQSATSADRRLDSA